MIEELTAMVNTVADLLARMDKICEAEGVQLVSGPVQYAKYKLYNGAAVEVHVYKGITKLSEMFGAELIHPVDTSTGKVYDDKIAFLAGDILFFELEKEEEE